MPDKHFNLLVSAIIPVYNEREVLPEFANHLKRILASSGYRFEILFIDDGSQDQTFTIIEELAQTDRSMAGLQFSRNFGKEAAMLAGLEQARGDCAVVLDGDGQHPPELIPEMLELWQTGEAVIIKAVKEERSSDSIPAKICARCFNSIMSRTTGLDMQSASDFQLLDRKVIDSLLQMGERNRFFRGMTSWTGFETRKIPFTVSKRLAGKTSWSVWKLGQLALNGITSYTSKPLTFVLGSGLAGIVFSFILALQALWSWFQGIAVSGWTSLTIIILFFGSANLMAIGLIGVYLARVFEEVKARPHFIIKKRVNSRKPQLD